VVDREEAIEAERERRRAERAERERLAASERAERERLAASERRAAFVASVRLYSRPFIDRAKGFGESLLVIFLISVALMVIALFLDAFVAPSFNGYPLPFEERVEIFSRRLPAALFALLQFFVVYFPNAILRLLAYMAPFFWSIIPWFGLFILALLLLKFAVFPLVRFLIRKVRN
jgi:hypothetical protein